MYSMNYIGKFISNFRDFYNEINAATLTGAIDVIVVEQDDGTFTCSPFHVRFGKLGVLRSREKVVDIEINGEAQQIHMKLGDSGEAFFVEEVIDDGTDNDLTIPPHLACSPIPDDNCFPQQQRRFQLLSNLPKEQHEKILRDSVLSIEREKLEQMSLLPIEQRKSFLIEQFTDLPAEHREKWLKIAALTYEERDKIFRESLSTMSTLQKQQMIRDEYSALKIEDREKLFKENFPELPAEQRPTFEKALLNDWRSNDYDNNNDDDDDDKLKNQQQQDEIFDMDNINDDTNNIKLTTPKSFVAVTSSDRIRKISVVNNDFRPITDDLQSSAKEKSSDESNTSIDPKVIKDDAQDDVKVTMSSKKKRKKKSFMKKKGSQRKASNGSSSQTEVSENDVPIIDDSSTETMLPSPSPVTEDVNTPIESLSSPPPPSDYHFFSDTEVTKNRDSRPSSPVQSDTEFEMRKIQQEGKERDDDKTHQQSWRWGELPSPPPEANHSLNPSTTSVPVNDAEAQRSMLSGMFSFMKKTSRVRHNPESEGIYLSDINADELDPEVAALYFPSSHRESTVSKERKEAADEEDTESGNGPSLPQSPNSVEGAIGGCCKSLDSDYDEQKQYNQIDISMSLCGGLDSDIGPTDEAFNNNKIYYNDICNDIKLYDNPNLVIKINGKYYNWTMACPIIVTLAAFQRYLPQHTIENLYTQYISLTMHNQEDNNKKENINVTKDNEGRRSGGYSSWFSWRRSSSQPPKKNSDISEVDGPQVQSATELSSEFKDQMPVESTLQSSEMSIEVESKKEEEEKVEETLSTKENSLSNTPEEEKSQPELIKKQDQRDGGGGYSGSEDSDSNQHEPQGIKIPKERRSYYESSEKYRKTLRLSSEQIASLNLKEGPNEVVFSVTTAYQGTSRCKCHIYKWRWDDKIVISDIDGTITKSDVLGHILPIVGKDWAQSGVAQLFTKIKNNGYKLLYLSARAIGQARVTREYLKSIKQGDLSLPEGPLLLNPTSLISAFHREVIEKKPERFKISCLSDIQALFPEGSKPFYAGYGNRINDVWAYRAVGIPIMRIFTINHRGELKHELTQTFQSSYSNMSFIVDHLFPVLREDAADEFSNFAYWRDPILELPSLETLSLNNQATQ